MRNPLKFLQEVKQEAFKITWPTKKDTVTGSLMVFVLASLAAVFFLLLDQILKFFLNLILILGPKKILKFGLVTKKILRLDLPKQRPLMNLS